MITDRTNNKSRVNTVAVDQSALSKSAAWAWFQHRSTETDGPPEIAALRKKIQPKPSRYKLEALKQNLTPTKIGTPRKPCSNKRLLDNYEIERISRQLQYHVESSRAARTSGGGAAPAAVAAAASKDKVVQKKKITEGAGFWFWPMRHVPACGSSIDDVVGGGVRRRRP